MGVLLFLLIFFFVSFCIVGLVLLQEGKGGGLTGMSTGMDGVMGARNPLRRWTAYLFILFVLLCLIFNLHLHRRSRVDDALPTGMEIPRATTTLPEGLTLPEGSLRPSEDGLLALPIPENDGDEDAAEEAATTDAVETATAAEPADEAPKTPVTEDEADEAQVVGIEAIETPALTGEPAPEEENIPEAATDEAIIAAVESAMEEEASDAVVEAAVETDAGAGDDAPAGVDEDRNGEDEDSPAAQPSSETTADDE